MAIRQWMTCLEVVQPVDFAVLISNETIGGGSDKYGGGGDFIVGHGRNKGKGVKEEGGSFDHRAVHVHVGIFVAAAK